MKQERLGSVAVIDRKSLAPGNIPDGVLYVGLENISGEGRFLEVEPIHAGELNSNKFQFSNQHVLYGKLRPYLKKIALPSFEGICSTDILPIRPKQILDRQYLFYFLRQPELIKLATERSTGVNLPRLSPKQLLDFEIPLPPLDEQRRIAAILDQADALRQKRRRALARLDDLLQSVFLEMFGDPVTNPKRWDVVKLEHLTSHVSSGSTPKGGSSVYVNEGHLFIRSQNVLMFDFDFSDVAYITNDIHNSMKRTWVKNNDILLNITGASIGRVNYYHGKDNEANVNQHVCIIRPNQKKIASAFLTYHLGNRSYQNKILGQNKGATRQAFNFAQIRDFDIVLPPIELQYTYSQVSDEISKIRQKNEESVRKHDALFRSLQARVFRGEL